MRTLIVLLFIFITTFFYGQDQFEASEPENIKSVTLHARRTNAFDPIIRLGETLVFSFDDLDGDEKEYSYKIEHCTYDWKKSNLTSTEYSNGFSDDLIREYENSFNTYQNYTHYSLKIPNENLRIKISGNYLLSVMDEDEEVIFTRRFIVYQRRVDVGVSVHKARRIEGIDTKQNIEIIINHPSLLIDNPNKEIKVALYQNNDWNNVITDLKPQFFRGTQMIYKYGDESTFWAGNEFLYFETKDVRNATNNIRRVILNDVYETRLYIDQARINKPYTYYPDINGNFFVRTINVEDQTLEADYTKVHFVYEYLGDNEDDIYVYGNFNNWQLTDENILRFNKKTQFYEADILLKQGFYNYTYVSVNEDLIIDNHTLEGSHFQTENNYNVLVYYHKFGSKYDQVIGFGVGSSENLQN
jgi:hypothetical protein